MTMTVRAFPETRDEPRKRLLLIPIILIAGGLGLSMLHPALQFIGAVLALAGALSVFLVGMVFADLWAASRRTRDIIKAREERGISEPERPVEEDPFIDMLAEDDDEV
ncbi:MAG: hypothetical protein JSW61_11950 [Candidatus Thorarchaeota archaeon]|nr:MAG: hypothetical protein JSW61_11950 [Candidatus Thorarchaeota archaeon]